MKKARLTIVCTMMLICFGMIESSFSRTVYEASSTNHATWLEGYVTYGPISKNNQNYLEVNGNIYGIEPDTRIVYREDRGAGGYHETETSLRSISENQKIAVLVRKNKIVQIILY